MYAHQVTLFTLAKLQREAWHAYMSAVPEPDETSFETWRQEMLKKSPTFLGYDHRV